MAKDLNDLDEGLNPFEYESAWNDLQDNNTTVIFYIVETSSLVEPTALFSATFNPGNVIDVGVQESIYMDIDFQTKTHLTDSDGNVHHTFTFDGVDYTVDTLQYDAGGAIMFFRIKSGSNNVDERSVFEDYSFVITTENDEVFSEEIANFEDGNNNWLIIQLDSASQEQNPFESTSPWTTWIGDSSINIDISIVETASLVEPTALFSATFDPNTVINAYDHLYGHSLPTHNSLTNDVGVAHNTFTLSGIEYTVSNFSYEGSTPAIFFEIKEGSNNVDERVVFADYSLAIVNENDETFTEEITEFEDGSAGDFVLINLLDTPESNPFESNTAWDDWFSGGHTVKFHIIETPDGGHYRNTRKMDYQALANWFRNTLNRFFGWR